MAVLKILLWFLAISPSLKKTTLLLLRGHARFYRVYMKWWLVNTCIKFTRICRDGKDSAGCIRFMALRQDIQPLQWYSQEPLRILRLENGTEVVAVVSLSCLLYTKSRSSPIPRSTLKAGFVIRSGSTRQGVWQTLWRPHCWHQLNIITLLWYFWWLLLFFWIW